MSEPDRKYERLSSMLDALGNTTALKILNEAAEGFESGKEAITRLGTTHRRYYRYLKRLNELGIVAPSGKNYHLTPLGKQLHKLVFNDALNLVSLGPERLDPLQGIGEKSELTIIDNYSDLIKSMNAAIEQSKSEILLTTRYVDLSVTQSLIYALQRGVKLKSVSNEKLDLSSLFKLLSNIARGIRPNFIRLILDKPDYKVGDVPMSFILIDGEISIFELPTKEFKIAFHTTDKRTVKLLSDLFRGIWNSSRKLRIPFQTSERNRGREGVEGDRSFHEENEIL